MSGETVEFTWEEAKAIVNGMCACMGESNSLMDDEVAIFVRIRARFPILSEMVTKALRESNNLRRYENKPEHAP